jgi:hypothetical protein
MCDISTSILGRPLTASHLQRIISCSLAAHRLNQSQLAILLYEVRVICIA